jgi:hypothetical protein
VSSSDHDRDEFLSLLIDIDHDGAITPLDFEVLAEKISILLGQGDSARRDQYANARKSLCQEIMRADANQDGKVTLGMICSFALDSVRSQ